jgi:predicted membrane-bound dolichyl-phosphate-mannose-protein mannosyltransferase
MAQRSRRTPKLKPKPITLLLAISVLSLAARVAWIAEPCRAPCRTVSDHVLVFDEAYYVNAARVIAGIEPPQGQVPPDARRYAGTPLGEDPNSEHPQLAKLVIAGSIELLGDGPLAWRLGSLIAGTLAILGMFALVRAAGGSDWLALGAAALMATDNLLLVHGRIGTLDIYVVAAMIWAVALYVRGRPVTAGALLGLGACFKLVAPYALLALVLFEALALWHGGSEKPRRVLARLGACALTAAAVFIGLLALLDRIAPPNNARTHAAAGGGPLAHLGHMLSYAAHQTSPHGLGGIASYPWEWLVDLKPIVYLNINPSHPAPGLVGIHPPVHFLGMISPPILLAGLLGLLWWAWRAWRVRDGLLGVCALAVAWVLGTFLPFLALSLFWQRTSYLYYMVVVMPGLYIAAAAGGLALARRHRRVFAVWVLALIAAVVLMYPFTPLP